MQDSKVISVKKFSFNTYDVFLEINRKLVNGKPKYWYHRYAQKHPIRDRNVQPYNEEVSEDFDTPCEVVFSGYLTVEVFERKNKK